ncbi:MAG: adenosylhomocysteinase [Candidatus Omnitrophica bacterium]|nr:adenosylhomocysteinase [Candidatus Omnitrophota bacterium]
MNYDIKDTKLAHKGALRIEWARNNMPVLALIARRFEKERPLKGLKIAACLHVTTETGVLMEVLKSGGAELFLCASNPLSTQDDVAGSLAKNLKIAVFAIKGEDTVTYYRHLKSVLAAKPDITMDDGADLVSTIHQAKPSEFANIKGGTEETTTGVCGYGWCGRGVSMRAKGMAARVVVVEVDPLRALEATMDGYEAMTIKEAAKLGDVFVTVTGDINVIRKEHFLAMKDGAIVANSGHFNVEIDIPALEKLSKSKKCIRDFVDEYILRDGRKIYLLGEGRLINLAAAEGHPAQVMDMSFANQALSAEYIVRKHREMKRQVYKVPEDIDKNIAALKLKSMGIQVDVLTAEQKKYLSSWEMGT